MLSANSKHAPWFNAINNSVQSIEMAQSFRTCVLLLLYVGISHCSLKDEILRDKIVIVGAGASGIAAASKLLELGYQNIVVLEAQNRIGGRVRTEFFGDDNTFIELGTHL